MSPPSAAGGRTRAVLSWSGGKDAATVLHELDDRAVEVVELMTTINPRYGRSTIHGVRAELYDRQAAAIGLPINLVEIPAGASNDAYAERMDRVTRSYADRGVDAVLFGDINLEDVRAYREDRLAGTGLVGRWPLWGRDTDRLVRTFLDAGFRATVVAADAAHLDAAVVGRELSARFVDELPPGVDPAGEGGEFHTFVHDGPTFDRPVPVDVGGRTTRDVGESTIHYADLEPA